MRTKWFKHIPIKIVQELPLKFHGKKLANFGNLIVRTCRRILRRMSKGSASQKARKHLARLLLGTEVLRRVLRREGGSQKVLRGQKYALVQSTNPPPRRCVHL